MFNHTRTALLQSGHTANDWTVYLAEVRQMLSSSDWGGYFHVGLPGGALNQAGRQARLGETIYRIPNLAPIDPVGDLVYNDSISLEEGLPPSPNTCMLSRDLTYQTQSWPTVPVAKNKMPEDLAEEEPAERAQDLMTAMNGFALDGIDDLSPNDAMTVAVVFSSAPYLKIASLVGSATPEDINDLFSDPAPQVFVMSQSAGGSMTSYLNGTPITLDIAEGQNPLSSLSLFFGTPCLVVQQLLLRSGEASLPDVLAITALMRQSVEVPRV